MGVSADLILVYAHRATADMVYITDYSGHVLLDTSKYSFFSYCQINGNPRLGRAYGIGNIYSDKTNNTYNGSWNPGMWDQYGSHKMGPGYACYGVTNGKDLSMTITAETTLHNYGPTIQVDIYGYDLLGKVPTEADVLGYMKGSPALTPKFTLSCKLPYNVGDGVISDPGGTVKYDHVAGTIVFLPASGRTGITCQ